MNRAIRIFDSCRYIDIFYSQTRNLEILTDTTSVLQPTISLLLELNLNYTGIRGFTVLAKVI